MYVHIPKYNYIHPQSLLLSAEQNYSRRGCGCQRFTNLMTLGAGLGQ